MPAKLLVYAQPGKHQDRFCIVRLVHSNFFLNTIFFSSILHFRQLDCVLCAQTQQMGHTKQQSGQHGFDWTIRK